MKKFCHLIIVFFLFIVIDSDDCEISSNKSNKHSLIQNDFDSKNQSRASKKSNSPNQNSFNKYSSVSKTQMDKIRRSDKEINMSSNLTRLSGITKIQTSSTDSDKEENISKSNKLKNKMLPKTPTNSSFHFANTSSIMRNQKPIIKSDSEDDTPKNIHSLRKNAKLIIDSDSEEEIPKNNHRAVKKNVRNNVKSNSEDENINRPTKHTVQLDSGEELVPNPLEEVTATVESELSSFESAGEEVPVTDDDQQNDEQDDVLNISTKLNSTKLDEGNVNRF